MVLGSWSRDFGPKDQSQQQSIRGNRGGYSTNLAINQIASLTKPPAQPLARGPLHFGFAAATDQAGGRHSIPGDTTRGRSAKRLRVESPLRSPAGNSDEDYAPEDEDEWPAGNGGDGSDQKQAAKLVWACHFFRLDPERHARCGICTFHRISDLKQHLDRSHSVKNHYYCRTCQKTWKSAKPWISHMNQLCRLGANRGPEDSSRLELLLEHEINLLAGAQFFGRRSDYDKWYLIWDTFFTGYSRPASPYLDDFSIETNLRYRTRLDRVLKDQLLSMLGELGLEVDTSQAQSLRDNILRASFDNPASQTPRFRVPTQGSVAPSQDGASSSQHMPVTHGTDLSTFATRNPSIGPDFYAMTQDYRAAPPRAAAQNYPFADTILMRPNNQLGAASAVRARGPATNPSTSINQDPSSNLYSVHDSHALLMPPGDAGPSNEMTPSFGITLGVSLDPNETLDPAVLSIVHDQETTEGIVGHGQGVNQSRWRDENY